MIVSASMHENWQQIIQRAAAANEKLDQGGSVKEQQEEVEAVGRFLADCRRELGLNRKQLAEATDVDEPLLLYIETGIASADDVLETLTKLAPILKLTPAEVLSILASIASPSV